jgi:hypothetical protein
VIASIYQTMRRARLFLARRLGRADIHAAVHLRRIHADDFHRERIVQLQRERGLPRRRRAHEENGGREVGHLEERKNGQD